MATATTMHWPFVGRHGELERLTDALSDGLDAVLVTGASGVGKTRLATECLAEAEARGHPVAHVAATTSAAAVPLSVLAPLLPVPVDLSDPHALFDAVRQRLNEQSGGQRFVLAVDDVDLLDAVSLALLQFLLADGTLFVIATQRTESKLPDALESRWRGGRALRVSLDELERHSVDTLLHFALGGPVSAAAGQALWEASHGNVLYLRELVLCAQRDGTLTCDEGVWRLTGQLTGSAGVVELVSSRLNGLDQQQRTVLELLALCEPLAVDDLIKHTPVDMLVELESQGLIQVRTDGRRQDVTLAHPLHAQALQQSMPRLRARSLLLAQVDRIEGYGARRRGDPLLLASWRLDATGTADPELLVRAAQLARFAHDLPRTERLAEAALRHGADTQASLLLGEALHERARYAEAEQVLGQAAGAMTQADALRLTLTRALNLYFGLSDVPSATDCLAAARQHGVADDDPALAAVEALLLNDSDAVAAGQRLGEQEPSDTRDATRVLWLRARATVLADAGQLVQATAAATRGFELHQNIDYRMVISHPATQLIALGDALLRQGQFDQAAEIAGQGSTLAVTGRLESLIGWFPAQLGAVALARGQVATAERQFREALGHLRETGRPKALPVAHSGLLVALAWQGRLAPDDPMLAEASLVTAQARAWALAAAGQQSEARLELQTAAEAARAQGRLAAAHELLHDALRLGDLTAAKNLLDITGVDGELAGARAAHAQAAVRRDPSALAETGQAFAGLGANLLAAEALIAAAEIYRADDSRRSAAGCMTRAAALIELCEGARTPGLVVSAGHNPLSDREREVALLVAQGHSSKEIAERLYLSVRTVDNHLQNIYSKCGVNSRSELAAMIGTANVAPARKDGRA